MDWATLPVSPKGDAVRATLARRKWMDPSMPITKELKQNPGKWALVSHTTYKNGYHWYRQRGFQHAVRARGGGWDNYLRWPEDE